jgi:hypothetical protein
MADVDSKVCCACHVLKLLTEYSADRRSPLGVQHRCRDCCRAAKRAAYHADPEAARAKQLAYYNANKERVAAINARLRQRHADRVKARKRAAYLCERDTPEFKAKMQAYVATTKDRKRAYDRAYRERKAEHLKAVKAAWMAANPDLIKSVKNAYKARRRQQEAGGDATADIHAWEQRAPKVCVPLVQRQVRQQLPRRPLPAVVQGWHARRREPRDRLPDMQPAKERERPVRVRQPDGPSVLTAKRDHMSDIKPTNPKDAVGSRKAGISCVPLNVLAELGAAMTEGALKYGRHNWRGAGVRASIYLDAQVGRHLFDWWEGEDVDPDSGINHITKAIAGLVVLRDSMMRGNWVDDRPPRSMPYREELNRKVGEMHDKHADKAPHHWTIGDEIPNSSAA